MPPKLRNEFKQSLLKSKYKPMKTFTSQDDFENISEAIKNFMEKNKGFHIPTVEKQNKYIDLVRQKTRRLKKKDIDYMKVPKQVLKIRTDNSRKQYFKRLVVPNFSGLEDVHFKPYEKITEIMNQHSVDLQLEPKLDYSKSTSLLKYDNPINKGNHLNYLNQSNQNLKETISNNLEIVQSYEKDLKKLQEDNKSNQQTLESPFSAKSQSTNALFFSKKLNKNRSVRIHTDSDSEKSIDMKYARLVDEEKKLIDVIRLQQLRKAQKKGEESQKALEKNQQKKKIIDNKLQEFTLKRYEDKKIKIKNAQLKREGLIMEKSKHSPKIIKCDA